MQGDLSPRAGDSELRRIQVAGFAGTKRFVLERLLPATEDFFDSKTVCNEVLVLPDQQLGAVAQVRGPSLLKAEAQERAGNPAHCTMEISESIAAAVERDLDRPQIERQDPAALRVSLYVLMHEAIESMDARGAAQWSLNSHTTEQAGLSQLCEGITDLATTKFQDHILFDAGIRDWSALSEVRLTKTGYRLEQAAADLVISGLCQVAHRDEWEEIRSFVRANPGLESIQTFIRRVLVASEKKDLAATGDKVLRGIAAELSDDQFKQCHRKIESLKSSGGLSRVLRGKDKEVPDNAILGLQMGAKAWKRIRPMVASIA